MPGHTGDEPHVIQGLRERLDHPDPLVRLHAAADLAPVPLQLSNRV